MRIALNAAADTPADEAARSFRPVTVRAGPLVLDFDGGDLRAIRNGDREIVRRIHAAVRDRDWDTVPGTMSRLGMEIGRDSFRIRYVSTHRRREIHFSWRAEIVGRADGALHFNFEGEAHSTFLRNRIGLCVLHPAECAGVRCRVRRVSGEAAELAFPRLVEPAQPVPGMHDLALLAHEVAPGLWAELRFEGDAFEMEDQRNWTDASFKTFSTPLRLPFPVEVPAGTRIRQAVQLRLMGRPLPAGVVRASRIRVTLNPEEHRLPPIGLGCATHGQPFSSCEVARLRALRSSHLRVDVRLEEPGWRASLQLAREQQRQLETALELAVHLPPDSGAGELDELARALEQDASSIARILLFRAGERTLSAAGLNLARPTLARFGAPIGAGTDADFYQLNQSRPPHEAADFVHWSMNPQVHAFDLRSIAETPAAVAAQLESARAFFPGKPLVVSPITLKPRFNAVATSGAQPAAEGELPPSVDPRQASPFAAAWALAMIKQLAENGAASLTCFETTGWRGIMERDAGSPEPGLFRSRPGQLFPLYHLLAELADFRGGNVIATTSTAPLRVVSLALAKGTRSRLLLANLTADEQEVSLHGYAAATGAVLESSVDEEWHWKAFEPMLRIELPAFGQIRLESQ